LSSDVVVTLDAGIADSLTVGEIEEIEELSGQSVGVLSQDSIPKGKVLRAIAFVIARRDDPAMTWEDSYSIRVKFPKDGEEGATSPTSGASASRRRAG
jgi:hypothetical protein